MTFPHSSAQSASQSDSQDVGQYGEQLVCQWLAKKNCQVLHQRWHSRFGEIDLIAKGQSGDGALRGEMLAFIEVKTRSQGNWDADGLMAVTRTKQKKLRTTARYFLVRHPHLSELPCRFDIALVSCSSEKPERKLSLQIPGSQKYVTLQRYLRDAFC
ncbi:MAG: YraN family protein [Cyanobacteria bacterium J06627_32]